MIKKNAEVYEKSKPFVWLAMMHLAILLLLLPFDFRANSGWRNTDVQSQTWHYANGSPFSEPTVNVSRNKFGTAFLETSLPLLPYVASLIVPLVHENENDFEILDSIGNQTKIPHATIRNISYSENERDDTTVTLIQFEKYRRLVARLLVEQTQTNIT